MIEPLLDGIVLGTVTVTILGLLVSAYLQFRRENKLLSQTKSNKD